jgi:hypothetical protein
MPRKTPAATRPLAFIIEPNFMINSLSDADRCHSPGDHVP